MDGKYVVYVLQSADGHFYKGMTSNLERRLVEHKQGNTKSTRNFGEFTLVYTETAEDSVTARIREKYLKSAAGRRFLKKVLGQ